MTATGGRNTSAAGTVRGADILAGEIARRHIDAIFSLSGNQIMPLYDALYDHPVRLVHTRHEAACVFMADAWAQLSGKVGVALVTAAPGFANALGALYSAAMAESAVLFLSGDSPLTQDGSGAFQEFAQCSAAAPFVKHTERLTSAASIIERFSYCCDIAQEGRPGPVHLALPMDVLNETVQNNAPGSVAAHTTSQQPTGMQQELRTAVNALHASLQQSVRPLIITGPALSAIRTGDMHERVRTVLRCPIVTMESPRGLNDPALGNLRELIDRADLLVLLGKQMDFTMGFGRSAIFDAKPIVAVDDAFSMQTEPTDGALARLTRHAASPLHCLAELLSKATPVNTDTSWLSSSATLLAQRQTVATEAPAGSLLPDKLLSHTQQVIEHCCQSVAVCDGGEFGQWSQALINADKRVINGMSGAIGGSLAAAIGAQIADPQATVFVFMGDGTIGFHLAELDTAVREQAGIIVIIGNDNRWNAEHLIQMRDYGPERTHACTLSASARYDQVALAFGADGYRVTNTEELAEALAQAINNSKAGRPTCIDVALSGLPAPQVAVSG